MIRLRGVTLRAPGPGTGPPLLDAIDLDIPSNAYISIVGPNGAGKSLLLQVVAGLRKPSAGEIVSDLAHLFPALVFQNPDDQIVGSTVERDLAFGLENRAVPPAEIRVRVDEALRWSGLEASAGRPPHLLSDGEKQRLALTSALIVRPELLLLDEPTARLDPPARRLFLDAVQRVRRDAGTAVVQVTHRSDEVLAAERIVGLAGGRKVFDGTPAELFTSGAADGLGILWTGLHRFRRRLLERGVTLGGAPGPAWNALEPVLLGVRT